MQRPSTLALTRHCILPELGRQRARSGRAAAGASADLDRASEILAVHLAEVASTRDCSRFCVNGVHVIIRCGGVAVV